MNQTINELVKYALKEHLIGEDEVDYSVNLLLDLLHLNEFTKEDVKERALVEILKDLLDYACEKGLCEDSVTARDLFDTKIMNCFMPRPHEVITTFNNEYQN